MKDNLNAEVALGTVTNIKEACAWLGYTYLFIRMKKNPLAYGIGWDEVLVDLSYSSTTSHIKHHLVEYVSKDFVLFVENPILASQ